MDIVRFDSQERVDLPDMTQVSFLVLGEFRRTVRSLIMGEEAAKIIRGFSVDPAAVPDATVTVSLDPGGGGLFSLAVMPENTGSLEHGQLVGDKGPTGSGEGSSQQILDFAAQPVGSYTVEMRFVYSDGTSDNRAFWNEATDTEFLAATDTRHKPVWQAQYVLGAGTGGEWLKLADVAWAGATIVLGDITDARDFAFEGAPPYEATTQAVYEATHPHDPAAQRGAAGVGVNAVYPALRALARQIADIKGQDETGNFNWFARTFGPHDANDVLADEQTKSLRTVDTVTYTIGDGSSTFGDFNGATGLESCLQMLEDEGASVAASVRIVIKTDLTAGLVCDIATGHTMNSALQYLKIEGPGTEANLSASHPAASTALSVPGGTLELVGIKMSAAPVNDASMFLAAHVVVRNCAIIGSVVAGTVVLQGGPGSLVENSILTGLVSVVCPSVAGDGDVETQEVVLFSATRITGALIANPRVAGELSVPVHLRDCTVVSEVADLLGYGAAVQFFNNINCLVDGCRVVYITEAHGIQVTTSGGELPANLRVINTDLVVSDVVSATGEHFAITIEGHNNWVVNSRLDITKANAGGIQIYDSQRTYVQGCQFYGNNLTGRLENEGAIYIREGCTRTAIENCDFHGWEPGTALARTISGEIATAAIEQINITGCTFKSCGAGIVFTSVTSVNGPVISGNSFFGAGAGLESGILPGPMTNGSITGNVFVFDVAAGTAIGAGAGAGCDAIVSGNRIHNGVISTGGSTSYYGYNVTVTDMNYIT